MVLPADNGGSFRAFNKGEGRGPGYERKVGEQLFLREGPVLPDETHMGDGLRGSLQSEQVLYKDIGFMYSSVLVPVLSALCGALVIVFGLLVYRCLVRRKLRKVRYYGSKTNADFIKLAQQMNLLSESESEYED